MGRAEMIYTGLPTGILTKLPEQMPSSLGFERYTLRFDGSDDYVGVPYDDSLAPQKLTVAVWVYPHDVTIDATPHFDHEGRGNSGYALRQSTTDGAADFYVGDGSDWYVLTSNAVMTNDRWYFVVGVFDGTNLYIYINGKQEGSRSANITRATHTGDFAIGRREEYADRYFDGLIAEVRIYNRALSEQEIKWNFENYHNPIRDGLVAWWPMEEGVGDTAKDIIGGNDGTLNGPVWEKVKQYELRTEAGL